MSDDPAATPQSALHAVLTAASDALAAEPNALDTDAMNALRSGLGRIESATPGGAPLHAQLDTVRKWLGVLEQPGDHARFGGAAHVRAYLVTQIRIAGGALEDYLRQMS